MTALSEPASGLSAKEERELELKRQELTVKQEELEQKRQSMLVDVWKQAVDTQKHFNEMSTKSRQLGLTFVAASLGAALFLFTRTTETSTYAWTFTLYGRTIVLNIAVFIVLAAVAGIYAVKQLDLGVYHKMLRGAVSFGEDLEERHIRGLVGLHKGMTQAISQFSRHEDAAVTKDDDGRYQYSGADRRNAGQKLNRFYNVVIGFLFVSAIGMFVVSNVMQAVK